ncbi:MAG TPA: hypothetical protein VJM34_11955 [Novosphingobium sp.]|nr:hypothetical protein [Novosphingobium sp.]
MYALSHFGLGLPTASLMSQGGDDRITIDERSGLNSYGCAPSPMTSVMYSSSTASSISSEAFRHVQAIHHALREKVERSDAQTVYAERLEAIRGRLRRAYGLADGVDVAFGPSGTDLEYLALAAALRDAKPVRNLVVEVEEVGSGCQFSQAGRYFAPRTAQGKAVTQGDPLPGFAPETIRVQVVRMRSEMGPVQAEAEYLDELEAAIDTSLDLGERPLLHVIHRSKTGIVAPDLPGLERLVARFGGRIDIAVDACQGRISPAAVRRYLDLGAMVFITGSKFFGAPPFSAFAFVPDGLSARMIAGEPAQAGLGDFFARSEMPARWTSCDEVLPRSVNFGMLLRLEAAMFEIQRVFALPPSLIDDVIDAFNAALRDLSHDLPFRLADAATASDVDGHAPNPLDRKMLHVVEITMPHPVTGRPLGFLHARTLYHLLYLDISDRFEDPDQILTASDICHLGQPVLCLKNAEGESAATLRFALSAPLISALLGLDADQLAERFRSDIERVGEKLRLAASLLDAQPDRVEVIQDRRETARF